MISNVHEEFIEILNNREGALLGKDQGVLLLVSPARGLHTLEEACFANQEYNSVITARYTLEASEPGTIFGTLLRKLVADVNGSVSSRNDVCGELRQFEPKDLEKFRTAHTPATWEQFKALAKALDTSWPSDDGTSLDPSTLTSLMKKPKKKAGNEFLSTGQRLIVFLQLTGVVEKPEEWSGYLSKLASILPYRTMLVISGLPDQVELNPDVPTQRHLTLEAEESTEEDSTEQPESIVDYDENPAISDKPSTGDELGRQPYANALARMVLHEQTAPPLSVGIHGPWGKGKSSFMEQIKEELHQEGEAAKTPVVTVDFNAWRYDDATQVWAGLLNKASSGIEAELGRLNTFAINLKHAVTTRTAELISAALLPTFLFVAAVSLGWLLGVNGIQLLKEAFGNTTATTELEKALLPVLGGFSSFLYLLKRLAAVTQPVSVRIANFVRLPSYSEELGFQHAVIDDLKFLQRALLAHRPHARVVVFIDDLDRCSEERIMEILQAIILVLAPSNFFVFLGIDTEMLYRAISQHYTTNSKPPDPSFPRQYLRKILQLSFHLPAIEQPEREKLFNALFSEKSVRGQARLQAESDQKTQVEKATPGLPPLRVDFTLLRDAVFQKERSRETVQDTPNELAAFRAYQNCLDDNPREIKRAVNVHRLMKLLMQRHGIPSDGWTTQRQRQLVRWVLFCTCWPELVGHALELAERRESEEDVLDSCREAHASLIEEQERRRRLSAITAEQVGDKLPPEAIDSSLRFVAHSSLLVEESNKDFKEEEAANASPEQTDDPAQGDRAGENKRK